MDSTIYENALGDALESLMAADCNDLESLAAGLAKLNVPTPPGQTRWDGQVLAHELRRLGE